MIKMEMQTDYAAMMARYTMPQLQLEMEPARFIVQETSNEKPMIKPEDGEHK